MCYREAALRSTWATDSRRKERSAHLYSNEDAADNCKTIMRRTEQRNEELTDISRERGGGRRVKQQSDDVRNKITRLSFQDAPSSLDRLGIPSLIASTLRTRSRASTSSSFHTLRDHFLSNSWLSSPSRSLLVVAAAIIHHIPSATLSLSSPCSAATTSSLTKEVPEARAPVRRLLRVSANDPMARPPQRLVICRSSRATT